MRYSYINEELILDTEQMVETCMDAVPDGDGNFLLYNPDNALVHETDAVLDNASWQVSKSSGRDQQNPRKLWLSDTAGLEVRRRYLLRESGINDDFVYFVEVASDHAIASRSLTSNYSTQASLLSTWLSAVIPAAVVDEVSENWRGVWEYTVDGEAKTKLVVYDVVRRSTKESPLTLDEVCEKNDEIFELIKPTRVDIVTKIQHAWEKIKVMLIKDELDVRKVRNLEIFDEAIYQQLLLDLIDVGVIPRTWASEKEAYRRAKISDRNYAYQLAISNIQWYDIGDDEKYENSEKMRYIRILERY